MSIRVLVACEASQKTTIAFRRLGIEAWSCDIQPCYGGHPEWHHQVDCMNIINLDWDLVIAHPPCTYLSRCQGNLIFEKGGVVKDLDRYIKGLDARLFFQRCLDCNAPFVCVENPRPLKCWKLPPPTYTIQPWEFGHPYTKATCLWLRGLPPLMPTDIIDPSLPLPSWVRSVPGFTKRTKFKQYRLRSETFQGIADAFASQYGSFVRAALHK